MIISTDTEKNLWKNPIYFHEKNTQYTKNRIELPQLHKSHPQKPTANITLNGVVILWRGEAEPERRGIQQLAKMVNEGNWQAQKDLQRARWSHSPLDFGVWGTRGVITVLSYWKAVLPGDQVRFHREWQGRAFIPVLSFSKLLLPNSRLSDRLWSEKETRFLRAVNRISEHALGRHQKLDYVK